jgi:hypothetical protein
MKTKILPICILSLTVASLTTGSPGPEFARINPADKVNAILSSDYSVQLMGGYRWDFHIKTTKTKVLVVDFGFGKDDWEGTGQLRHFYPHDFRDKEGDILTICLIPEGPLLLSGDQKVKFKMILALNGKPGGGAYIVEYAPGEKYRTSTYFQPDEKGTLPVDVNGNIRLLKAWRESPDTSREPDSNLLLGFFEYDSKNKNQS